MDYLRIVKTLVLALAISSLYAAPSLAQVSHQTQAAPAPQAQPFATTEPQLGTERAPLIVETHAAPEAAAQVKRETDDRNAKALTDWITIGLTLALVVIGAIQARVYYVQSGLLKKTIAESIETRRPWIRPWIKAGTPPDPDKGETTPIILKFKNVGDTPAVDFELRYQFFDLVTETAPTDYSKFWRAQNLGNVVFPGDKEEIAVPLRVAPGTVPNPNLGLVVAAIYRTQGSPELHVSPVCYRISVPTDVPWLPSGDLLAIKGGYTISQEPRSDLHVS